MSPQIKENMTENKAFCEASRESEIKNFLARCNLANAERQKIPGDASFRRYERIVPDSSKDASKAKTYILMDCPPQYERVDHVIQITDILLNMCMPAPKIYEKDEANGFLLIEDFGSMRMADGFAKNILGRNDGYKLSVDLLAKLSRKNLQKSGGNLPAEYNFEVLLREAMLFWDWYVKMYFPLKHENQDLKNQYVQIIENLCTNLKLENKYLVLRDYHAENIMIIQDKSGAVTSLGIIDFQDALVGNVAYDLVSLLEDARIDVSETIQRKMIEYFVEHAGLRGKYTEFMNDYATLGAQRNLKILGIFCRLNLRDNKPKYLDFLPRVAGYLKQDLNHPALRELAEFLEKEQTSKTLVISEINN